MEGAFEYEIEDFLANRCLFVQIVPNIFSATEEVLKRLPGEVFESLFEKDVYLVFPQRIANTVFRLDLVVPPNSGMTNTQRWLVVLADYLIESSHGRTVGTIVHELAHVYLGQSGAESGLSPAMEQEADNLASDWGFAREILESKS